MVWWRYIDDIYGEGNLLKFIHEINSYHATIKFTAEWSRESVVFLDTRVIREGNKLITDIYTKPTDTHQYLHQRSCHPTHCKYSIAYSQALRLRRICSRDTDYQRHTEELKMYLVNRGYDGERIQQEIDKATGMDRETLLISCKKDKRQVIPLVVGFHPDLPHMMRILHQYQCVIDTSPRLKKARHIWETAVVNNHAARCVPI